MPLPIRLVTLLALTVLSTSACSEGPKPYFRLLKYGETTSSAIRDAYQYALAQRYGQMANVDNTVHSPITHKFDTLCSPVASRHISNELLREQCAVLLKKKTMHVKIFTAVSN